MNQESFDGKERRAYVRLDQSLPVRFKISTEKINKTYTATTKNISQGGICLEIHQDTEELMENLSAAGSKIGIDLDTMLPRPPAVASKTPEWVNSRVDWTRKPTDKDPAMLIGLEFEGVTDEARKRIHDYIVKEFVKNYKKPN